MWYVIGLIWIALMVGIVAAYKRKHRRRNAEHAEKMAALLRDLQSGPKTGLERDAAAAGSVAAAAAPAPAREFSRKPRLLPQSTALLYYVFRTGLPDHEIFAGLTLADVLDAGPASAMTEPAR